MDEAPKMRMKPPLNAEELRALCAKLGITAKPPLTERQVFLLTTKKPDGIHKGLPRIKRNFRKRFTADSGGSNVQASDETNH